MFEWVPRTLSGSLAHVGGAHGVDLAGLALGQVLVLSKKVHCMSLSSIHILYNHTPTERLKPNPEPWYGFTFTFTETGGSTLFIPYQGLTEDGTAGRRRYSRD